MGTVTQMPPRGHYLAWEAGRSQASRDRRSASGRAEELIHRLKLTIATVDAGGVAVRDRAPVGARDGESEARHAPPLQPSPAPPLDAPQGQEGSVSRQAD
ncbi:MAG: hypothetical protein AVDCRST_MAG53-705 [uncultured Solirubrobacteraceae bacterium]|uniref:Uncharacterized protein n=1 Tax=uncultured Solirubrobacteraceae bacterium TaxID=1162706 RepID=A0A6J4RSM8_9ACTN|nr:MAG: hypothetical protein AVDCRST_MAG53-705 [uncultured Solirubrobacteraceae bacterium]